MRERNENRGLTHRIQDLLALAQATRSPVRTNRGGYDRRTRRHKVAAAYPCVPLGAALPYAAPLRTALTAIAIAVAGRAGSRAPEGIRDAGRRGVAATSAAGHSAPGGRRDHRVYPVVFVDAVMVKVRDGQVTNRPIYVVIGVTVHGERNILGLWAGDGSEGAKFWLGVFTET